MTSPFAHGGRKRNPSSAASEFYKRHSKLSRQAYQLVPKLNYSPKNTVANAFQAYRDDHIQSLGRIPGLEEILEGFYFLFSGYMNYKL